MIEWGSADSEMGLIAGGGDNGAVSLWNPAKIIRYRYSMYHRTVFTVIKRAGGPQDFRSPTLKIEFLVFLDTREQELPASFYPI